jgi:hypothetical protein
VVTLSTRVPAGASAVRRAAAPPRPVARTADRRRGGWNPRDSTSCGTPAGAAMMASFVVLVHAPRVLAHPDIRLEWTMLSSR